MMKVKSEKVICDQNNNTTNTTHQCGLLTSTTTVDYRDNTNNDRDNSTCINKKNVARKLLSVIKKGDYDELLLLLSTKPDLNVFINGQTALHHCLLLGRDVSWCQQLVNNGANPNLSNKDGWHPIHLAAFNGLHESLTYLITCNTIISSDYLTRIQLNTIKGYQVYFPIPFQEYNLRPGSSGSPEYSWTIKKDNGFFNWFDYRHVAFYLDDFEQACDTILSPLSSLSASIDKQSAETNKLLVDYDLLQLFLQFNCHSSINSGLHILRSIDPELRLRYRNEKCDPEVDRFTQHWCNMTRVYSLGNKAQLANLILNYKKIKFSN